MEAFTEAVNESLAKLNKAELRLKEKQLDALFSVVVNKKDTICVLPTGYGKSLIYQLLPFMFDNYSVPYSSSVLVISPLNALMMEQITKLEDVLTVTVMRSHVDDEHDIGSSTRVVYTCERKPSQIIFAHPEAVVEDKRVFRDILKSKQFKDNLKAIVVDEAHLIVEWKTFRPSYGELGMLASIFPDLPILALTATATKKTIKDIEASLGMIHPQLIESNPDRPNIFFNSCTRPSRGEDKLDPILKPLIEELEKKRLNFPLTLVYGNLNTIADCYSIASQSMGKSQYEPLGSKPISKNRMFTQFHAQYPEYERERIVKELVAGTSKLRLLFVTIAFGIGIDVQNIRRVIHVGVPHTIEEFFQEAGRCGRDGLPAISTVYYNAYDISSSRRISGDMVEFVSGDICKREKLLSYFGYTVPERNFPDHVCCDYHAKSCNCDDCAVAGVSDLVCQITCSSTSQIQEWEQEIDEDLSSKHQLSLDQKEDIRNELIKYRQTLHGSGRSCVGSLSLCTGFTMELIEDIIQHADDLVSVDEVKKRLPLFDHAHADAIFDVVKGVQK